MTEAVVSRRRLTTVLTGLVLAGMPLSVEAKGNCDAQGGLLYLGNVRNDTRSMWLSATSPGSFRLEAAQGNTTVDQWSKDHRGLHITASPFVSTGNGGVHRLFDTSGNKDCLIDTQNQKGGIPPPPHIIFPGHRPRVLPAIVFPDFQPIRPMPMPTPTPVGPIPTPIKPMPMPTPGPIPTPIRPMPMPTPVGPVPTPIRPMPMPVFPPGPTPPGPTPPGPIPPGPIPPGPTPPGPTPVSPVGPAQTVTVTPALPWGIVRLPGDDRPYLNCPDARTRATLPPGTRLPPECEDPQRASAEGVGQVPITPGRDLGVGVTKDWNLWADGNFVNVSDGRYGLDVTGWSRVGTIGLDRRITDNFVLGLYFSWEDDRTGGYGGFFSASTSGPTIGPYAALMLSDNWAIDASLGYSRLWNTMTVAVLDGSFVSQRLSANVNLRAQYDLDVFTVRPRLTGNYIKTFSDAYEMQGSIFGQALSVTYGSTDYDYATVELAAEFNKLFTMKNGDRLMPFAEIGAIYEPVRPNGGQILTSDLLLVVPSPWSFQARAGVRMLISDAVLLEARAGYLSFGQSGLDVVEGRLYLSVSF